MRMDFEMFLARLRQYMDETGDTPAGLATRSGLDNSTIRQWFEGRAKSARMSTVEKVCRKGLGMTYEEFMSPDRDQMLSELRTLWFELTPGERRGLLGVARSLRDAHNEEG